MMNFRTVHAALMTIVGIVVALLMLYASNAWAGRVFDATGGNAISSDTVAPPDGTGAWTVLSGPTYAETGNNDLNNGTVTLTVPAGFEFNPSAAVSVVLIHSTSNDASANINNTAVGGNVAPKANVPVTVTATTITFTIFDKSQGNTKNTIQWRGIQVRPLNGFPLATGNITASGSSGIATAGNSTNFGTLVQVPGAMTRLLTVLPGQTFTAGSGISGTTISQTAGIAFNLARLVATDQFFNPITGYDGTKTISYSGPESGCSIAPSYTTSVNFTDGFSTTTLATTLRKVEAVSITASDGTVSGPASSPLTVNPGPLSRLVVTLPGQIFIPCFGSAGTPSNQVAGVAFNIASITATDANFNVVTSYAGSRTLSYSGPSGPASYTTAVNFSAGQTTTTLATTISNAQTTTISVSDGTLAGPPSSSFVVSGPTVASFNAFETATAAGTTTGGVIKTKVAGSAFGFDIVALTSTSTVSTGFTGTVKVELVDSSAGGSCTTWPVIQLLADQTFTAAGQGRHTVTGVNQPNAWRNARVRISHPVTSPTIINCSSDNFAIRPSVLAAVAASDDDWQTAGTGRALNNTALGGIVHKAGQPFTIRATARNTAGSTTTNYAGTPIAIVGQCGSGAAVCPASVGSFADGTWSASNGIITTATATYSETGAFALQLEDRTFADVDAADSSTAERYITSASFNVGRFVPDHFAVAVGAITPRTDLPACTASSFTYMNEPFGVTYQLTARNAANGTTQNYAGTLATLAPTNASHLNVGAVDPAGPTALSAPITAISRANPGQVTTGTNHGLATGSRVYISGVGGMNEVNNATYTVTVIDASRFTLGTDTSAFGTYASGGHASRVAFVSGGGSWTAGVLSASAAVALQRAVQPDGPFNTASIGIAPQDADGVTALASAFDLDADSNGSNERVSLGTTELRFGRLRLQNAHGSEQLNLPLAMQAQFWNGTFFVTNTQDNCTQIASANNVVFNNWRGGITSGNMASPANVTLGTAVVAGVGRITLMRPSPRPATSGSVDVTLNLTAEGLQYLQGNWSGAGFNQNPRARAAFGLYKGGPVIHMREVF